MIDKIKGTIILIIIIFILFFTSNAFNNLSKQFMCKDKYVIDLTGTITGFTDNYKNNCI